MKKEEMRNLFKVSKEWVFKKRISYYKNILEDLFAKKGRWNTLLAKTSKGSAWLAQDTLNEIDKEIDKTERAMYYIKKAQNNAGKELDIDIEAIRQIPIMRLVEQYNIKHKRSGVNRVYCNLRNERTPSCCIYEDQNSFYDYGSGSGGSVIDFYMVLTGASLKDTIKELSNYL